MAQLTHVQYEALERAVVERRRVAIYRRGTEYIVVPHSLRVQNGREQIQSIHPTTGEEIVFYIDDIGDIQVIR